MSKQTLPTFVNPEGLGLLPKQRLMTIEEVRNAMRSHIAANQEEKSSGEDSHQPFAPVEAPPSIAELARALKYDVDLIFQFVHDQIAFYPNYGLHKGGLGALMDASGNAFDQSDLMVQLLTASGYTAKYVLGFILLDPAQWSDWLGIAASNTNQANQLLSSGGFTAGSNPSNQILLNHCWVQVNIGGTDYVFDPSFKSYNVTTGIDLASALQYDRSTFLASALSGSTVTTDYSQNVSEANISASLTTYGMNLVNWIRTNNSGASLDDIVGGRAIVPVPVPQRNTTLSYEAPGDTPLITSAIPNSYKAKIQIQYDQISGSNPPQYNIDKTFYTADIYGQRMSIFYNSSVKAQLYVNGTIVATSSAKTAGSTSPLIITVTHPYASTFADQIRSIPIAAGGHYAVGHAYGYTARQMAESHRQALIQNLANGGGVSAENVLGESLTVVYFNYMGEWSRGLDLINRLTNCFNLVHHQVAVLEKDSVFVLNFFINAWSTSALSPSASVAGTSQHVSLFWHLLEAGTVRQIANVDCASAPTIIQTANGVSTKVYRGTSSNWLGTVRPALAAAGYSSTTLDGVETVFINAGWSVFIPADATVTIGSWFSGYAYYGLSPDGSTFVGPLFNGAKGATSDNQSDSDTDDNCSSSSPDVNGAGVTGTPNNVTAEPIDLFKGRYLYSNVDISVGNQGEPYELSFVRTYNSGNGINNSGLGLGWSHNWQISVSVNTDGFIGLGYESVTAAAAAIAEMFVCQDLILSTSPSMPVENTVIVCLANEWLMDQLVSNTAIVRFGSECQVFSKLPDGSYLPPLGVKGPTSLVFQSFSFTYTTPDKVIYSFNSHNNISDIIYPFGGGPGMLIVFGYDTSQRLVSVGNSVGRALSLTYSGSTNKLSTVDDTLGRTVQYTLDSNNNLTVVKDPLSKSTTYSYDQPGRLTQIFRPANPTAAVVTNVYDTLGRIKQQSDAYNNTWNYFFAGSRSEEVDPNSNSRVLYLNGHGSVVTDVDALANATVTVLDGLERPTLVTLPEGNSTAFTYDTNSNVLSVTAHAKPGSGLSDITNTFTYDPAWNKVATATDGIGNTTTFTYDSSSGLLTQVQFPAVAAGTPVVVYTYEALNALLGSVTDPTGIKTSFDYLGSDLDTKVVDSVPGGLNLTTHFGHDQFGNVRYVTDANGNSTGLSFDNNRRLTQRQEAAPFYYLTSYIYDDNGNLTQVQRQTSTLVQQVYSGSYTIDNLVNGITEPPINIQGQQPNPAVYAYDNMRRQQRVVDAEGRAYTYAYDALSRIAQITDPTGVVSESRTYTANGYLESLTDALGHTTQYSYDGFDRLHRMTYADGTFEEYAYDANSNISQVTTRGGATIGYTYDALNRTVTKSPQGQATVTYSYDLAGRLTSASTPLVSGDPSTGSFQQFYDTAGRFFKERYPDGKTVTFGLDSNGNVQSIVYPDGSMIARGYDQLNLLTSVSHGAGSVQFSYDPLSRRISQTFGNGISCGYGYDLGDNLLSLTLSTGLQFSYVYNGVHQEIGRHVSDSSFLWHPDASLTNSYGTANAVNEYPSVNAISYSYNGSGCLTGDGTLTYSYDTENHLLSVAGPGLSVTYRYDPLGRQVQKTVGSTSTRFIYSGLQRIADYDASDLLINRYVYGAGFDEPVWAENGSGVITYLHGDETGSIIMITSQMGGVISQYSYTPSGESTSVNATNFAFTGQHFDPELALYYFKTRYYSPKLGRFLQPDPVGYGGGSLNLYDYASNDPLNLSDPVGLSPAGGDYQSAEPSSSRVFALEASRSVFSGEDSGGFGSTTLIAADPRSTYGSRYVINTLSNGAKQIIINPSGLSNPSATGTIHIGSRAENGGLAVNVGVNTQRKNGVLDPTRRGNAHTDGVSMRNRPHNALTKETVFVTTHPNPKEVEQTMINRVRQRVADPRSRIIRSINVRNPAPYLNGPGKGVRPGFLLAPLAPFDIMGPLIEYQWNQLHGPVEG